MVLDRQLHQKRISHGERKRRESTCRQYDVKAPLPRNGTKINVRWNEVEIPLVCLRSLRLPCHTLR